MTPETKYRPRVCAVSYLNTTPLVWGLEKTALGAEVELEFALPAMCADRVRAGEAEIGILPVIEIERQGLEWIRGTGIACRGPVRSILLVSKVPLTRVRRLAADMGSRTSVMLARILLAERYGAEPEVVVMKADLGKMLGEADAALIIGDPALLLDPVALGREYAVLDLGEEWTRYTGETMIFALWSGAKGQGYGRYEELFRASYLYGKAHLEEVVAAECPGRGIGLKLGREYLSRHIVFELEERDYAGMELYLRLARGLANLKITSGTGISHI